MTDWKELILMNYLSMGNGKKYAEERMENDPVISKMNAEIETAKKDLALFENKHKEEIHYYDVKMQELKDELKKNWDIQDKTFKCPAGKVTIKTTKSVVITNNSGLIERLTAILESAPKACDSIRSFDLSTIRKFMDADLIEEHIAHYDKNQSVIITGAAEK